MGGGDERRAAGGLEMTFSGLARDDWDAQVVDGGSWRAPLEDGAFVPSRPYGHSSTGRT